MSVVLIVEDDPAIMLGLEDNLQFEGHEVLTATDGETGYRLARDRKPELMILDLMLPKLNGLDICRKLRAEGHRIVQKGKRHLVADYERALTAL